MFVLLKLKFNCPEISYALEWAVLKNRCLKICYHILLPPKKEAVDRLSTTLIATLAYTNSPKKPPQNPQKTKTNHAQIQNLCKIPKQQYNFWGRQLFLFSTLVQI